MNNFLVAIAVFVIAVLGAAFAVPHFVRWENYRGVIEEEATRILGRDVRVGGGVTIRLLPSPTFSVERIRIADTEANTGEPFFQAEALQGSLAIAPLLRGVFQASEMVLRKPLLHLVLDGRGGGNWRTLGQGSGQLPFQLSEVALDQVKIEGGSLGIFGPDRAERLRLDAIDGILSAQALDGPFRFRGLFGTDPLRRELRLSTNKQEPDGSLRFKAALRQIDTGSVFNFDARAIDLAGSPRVEGELVATVPLPQIARPQAAPGAKPDIEAPVEVKAALSADLKLVKLANLSLAFERGGRPQILTGDASIDLSRSVAVNATLAAKWLDLDLVIGTAPLPGQEAVKPVHGPIEGLLTLAQRLNGFTPDQGQATLVLDVEQANLGREAVNGLRLSLQGTGAETDIRELRLGLPGGAQADVKGLMTGSGEETSFAGDIVLRGSSLTRFLGWATAGGIALDPGRDGAFAMRSKLVTTPGSVVAREFTGELAGTIMQGEIGYRWQGRPEISLLIEGPRVDLRAVLDSEHGGRSLSSLASYVTAGSSFGAQAGTMDAVLRVRAGELLVPGGTFVDAAADLELRDGNVRVRQLRLAADHGVTIDVEGEMPTAASSRRGTLRGTVSAATADGVATLAGLLAIPDASRPDRASLATFAPLRMAGAVTFGAADATGLDVVADGDIAGTRTTIKGRLDAGLAQWRTSPLDLAVTFHGANGPDLIRAVAGIAAVPRLAAAAAPAQALSIHAIGTPRDGVVVQATVAEQQQPRIVFNGRLDVAEGKGIGAKGDLRLDAADVATVLAMVTPALKLDLPPLAISGRAAITAADGNLAVDALTARVAGVPLTGHLTYLSSAHSVGGQLTTGDIPVAAVLQPLLSTRTNARPNAVWPATLFATRPNATLVGDIAIDASSIVLPAGLALANARFVLAMAEGHLELRDLTGRGAGGTWTGGLRLDQSADGAALTSALRFKDVRLATIRAAAAASAPVDGTASGVLTLASRGASPHDLMRAATGRGSLTLSQTRLAVLSPVALANILHGALAGPVEALPSTLREQLAAFSTPAPTLVLPANTIAIDVKAGIATFAPVGLDSADGKVLANLNLDLAALALSGTWRVDTSKDVLPPPPGWTTIINASGAPIPRKPQAPLPPIVASFTSAITGAGAKVEFATDALEREVAVRKVERDLEDLERLRKLDEERAKEEADRRRALEAAPPAVLVPGSAPITDAPPLPPAGDASTEVIAVPDNTDAAARARAASALPPAVVGAVPAPAPAPAPAPKPKPAYRPASQDELRRIFGSGG